MQNNFQTNGAGSSRVTETTPEKAVETSTATESAASDARFDLILLDPAHVRLFRTGGSALRLTLSDPQIGSERSYLRVAVARAFPLSNPNQYIGLRDGADKDIGMLVTLDGLEPETRALIDDALHRRYFLPRVTRVRNVREEFGSSTWEVDTDKGPFTFVVRNLRDSVQELTPTRILITDVDGSRFDIPDIRKLEDKSYAILQRVL